MGHELHIGIDGSGRIAGGFGLQPPHILGPVGDLALQIGEAHPVEIDDPDGADPAAAR